MSEKPVLEAKFAVSFSDEGMHINPITDWLYKSLVGHCAECSIPYHTDDAIYGALCMMVDVPADMPAIMQMLAVQDLMPDIVADYRPYFEPMDLGA